MDNEHQRQQQQHHHHQRTPSSSSSSSTSSSTSTTPMKRNDSIEVNLFSLTSNLNTLTSVSKLLSARKGNNKSYLSEKTPEDIEKETRIINSIDAEYFKDDFDIGYLLNQIPPDPSPVSKGYSLSSSSSLNDLSAVDAQKDEIDPIDKLSVKIYEYHEAVDSRFNDLIMKSYNGFVQGMSQVYEIEKDLSHSAVMCRSGKHYLDQVQKGLTAFGMILLQKHRKREIYKYILNELERIRDINDAGRKIDALIHQHSFTDAIDLANQSSKKIMSSSQYDCIKTITQGFETSNQLILDKIDSSFMEICNVFDPKIFESIITGYLMLDQKQRLKEKIHQYFISNIEDHTKKILRTHLLYGHSNPEELKSMKFVDMCKILKEEHYVSALLGLLEHLTDLMWSHYQMRKWILEWLAANPSDSAGRSNHRGDSSLSTANSTKNEKNSTSIQNSEREFYIEIFRVLFGTKKLMWNTIQNQIKHILASCSPSFKIEEFLKVLESVNQFIDIGQEFANEEREGTQGQYLSLLKAAMRDQSLAYFEHFHKKRIEDLKTMLENEMWHKVPLPNDFTVLDIQEFGGVMSSSKSSTSSTLNSNIPKSSSQTSLASSPFLSLNLDQTKPSLDLQVHDIQFFNEFKENGNPFTYKELSNRKTLNEVSGDKFGNQQLQQQQQQQQQQKQQASNCINGTSNTSSPLIASTTINVIRLIGKYLQMMKILKQLAYPIFTAIAQLLEYYVYSVYTFFGESANSLLFTDDSISNISPILRKTMQRLKIKFNAATTTPSTPTSSLLSTTHLFQSKLTASPISLRQSVDSTSSKSPTLSHLSLQPSEDGSISINWVLPKLSDVELTNMKTLYGLEYRIIGLESMMFIVDAIMEAQPLVFNLIPSDKMEAISLFYSETVSVVSALRSVCYKNIASQILNFEQIYSMISSVKWEPKDVQTESSPYVKQIFIEFHRFAGHLDEIATRTGVITPKVRNILWENTITFAMEALIEAYSRIKKCNNNGRTQMTMDVKNLQSVLEQLTTIRPIPHYQAVDKYIKAYFLPESDIFNLARDEEYTIKQVIGIVNVANHLKKPQKQKLLQDLEDLEKQRKKELDAQKLQLLHQQQI